MAWPLTQAKQATIESSEPIYYQIDGEGFVSNGPSTLTVSLIGNYPFIFNAQ